MHFIDWILVIVYLAVLVFVILRSRMAGMTMKNFAVDKQRTSSLLVLATLSASYVGPGYTMGLAEQGYSTGLLFFFIYLGYTIQTILVGIFVAPKLRQYDGAFTVGDILGFHYGKISRIFTGLISMLYCAGILGIVATVSGLLLEGTVGLPFAWGVIITTIVVVIYSTFGGMRTVLFTDIFQFGMLTLAVGLFCLTLFFRAPSFPVLVADLPADFLNPFQNISLLHFTGLFAGFFLGETLVPPYTNRAFVSKDGKSAQKGFVFAGIFSLLWFAMVISVGIIAKALLPDINPGDSFFAMANMFLPPGLLGLLMVAIISIIMSTQDSYLNASSVSFVRDIYESFIGSRNDKQLLLYSKITTFVIGLFGILFALQGRGIIDALLLNYTFWAPTVVLPMVIAILIPKKVKPLAGLVSIITGMLGVIIWKWVLDNPYGLEPLLIGIITNQVGFWLVHFFSKTDFRHRLLLPSSGCKQIV